MNSRFSFILGMKLRIRRSYIGLSVVLTGSIEINCLKWNSIQWKLQFLKKKIDHQIMDTVVTLVWNVLCDTFPLNFVNNYRVSLESVQHLYYMVEHICY